MKSSALALSIFGLVFFVSIPLVRDFASEHKMAYLEGHYGVDGGQKMRRHRYGRWRLAIYSHLIFRARMARGAHVWDQRTMDIQP